MMHQTNSAFRGAFFMGGSMIKRFFLSLALLAGLLSPAYSAGTISLSLTQQLDNATQKPLAGGKLYFFQAGTSTPQVAYQDTALTIPLPGGSIYTLDAGGRIPQFFLADGQIKIRLVNKAGVTQLAVDNILVIGPSGGGGGGGGTVDPTTILSTGDLKVTYGTGVLSGFVRANGRTVGSATSGATERANSDVQALFQFLWGVDANLAVSGGRGLSANADWVANKTITLPDWRGRALAGLDDMGNSAASRLTSSYFGTSAIVLGAAGGAESQTLTTAQIPAHSHPNTLTDPGHTHTLNQQATTPLGTNGSGSLAGGLQASTGVNLNVMSIASNTTGITITNANNTGGGGAHPIVPPTMLATIYLKL